MSACEDCHVGVDIAVVLRRDADAMDEGLLSGWSEHLRLAADEIDRLREQRDSWTRLEEARRDLIAQAERDQQEITRLCDIIERADAELQRDRNLESRLAARAILDEVDE